MVGYLATENLTSGGELTAMKHIQAISRKPRHAADLDIAGILTLLSTVFAAVAAFLSAKGSTNTA